MPQDNQPVENIRNYPDTADIMTQEKAKEPPPEGAAEGNPVLDAITTLQEFVVALSEKGHPKAEEMKQHLIAFLKATEGGGEEAPPEKEMPPEEEVPPEVELKGEQPESEAIKRERKQPVVLA